MAPITSFVHFLSVNVMPSAPAGGTFKTLESARVLEFFSVLPPVVEKGDNCTNQIKLNIIPFDSTNQVNVFSSQTSVRRDTFFTIINYVLTGAA
jgi:hypothetical protein